jgi:FeS assembly SUF system protein
MKLIDMLRRGGHLEEGLRGRVLNALRQIRDPEIPINIYDLGLIYDLQIDDQGKVHIQMTLTAPGCPVAQTFPGQVETAVAAVPGVSKAHVELVWDPPWDRDRMSDAARLELGMY